MIRFSPFRPADAPILSEIGATSLLESHGHSAPPEIINKYVDVKFNTNNCRHELSDEKNIFYGVHHNDQAAGYFKIIPNVPNAAVDLEPVTKLERLYLLKAFYNLKLGEPLLKKCIELSKAHGDKGMWLNVWVENHRAIRFYEKHGFKIVGEAQFPLTENHSNPNWVMLLEYEKD